MWGLVFIGVHFTAMAFLSMSKTENFIAAYLWSGLLWFFGWSWLPLIYSKIV